MSITFLQKGLTTAVGCVIIAKQARRDAPAPARRSGGIGRHPGLKIPWREISVTVRPRSPAPFLISYRGVEQLGSSSGS